MNDMQFGLAIIFAAFALTTIAGARTIYDLWKWRRIIRLKIFLFSGVSMTVGGWLMTLAAGPVTSIISLIIVFAGLAGIIIAASISTRGMDS